MPSYEAIYNAKDEVVGALTREGGELSYPELVGATRLPQEVVGHVVSRLHHDGRVEITNLHDDVRLVRLHKRSFGDRVTRMLGLK